MDRQAESNMPLIFFTIVRHDYQFYPVVSSIVYVSSKGTCESGQLPRLVSALTAYQFDKYHKKLYADPNSYYGKHSKFHTFFSFCSQIKFWLSRLEFTKKHVRIANRGDPDQTASSEAI